MRRVFFIASHAFCISSVVPDIKIRPDAPIICTSLITAFGAARSASLAATQAKSAGSISKISRETPGTRIDASLDLFRIIAC